MSSTTHLIKRYPESTVISRTGEQRALPIIDNLGNFTVPCEEILAWVEEAHEHFASLTKTCALLEAQSVDSIFA
jgi:hypothetical protein